MKLRITVDFDGVINSYESGWCGANVIPDMPVPEAINFLKEAVKHFEVNIFSSRSHQPGGIDAMKSFIRYWAKRESHDEAPWVELLKFPTEKPASIVYIDDRAIQFNGPPFPTMDEIKEFKPWNRR